MPSNSDKRNIQDLEALVYYAKKFERLRVDRVAEIRQVVKYAYLDEELFEFLQDPLSRSSLITVLVARWFPGRFELVKEISQTDKFRDPPEYLRDGYEELYNEQWKKI
jgi:putative restriction endonuclease